MGVSIIGGSSGGGPSVSLEQYIPTGATATLVDSGYSARGAYTTSSLSAGTYLLMANPNSNNQAVSFRWNAANRSYLVSSTQNHQAPAQVMITTTTATTFSIVNRNIQFNTLGRALRADYALADSNAPFHIGYGNGYYFVARRQLNDNLSNAFMYSTDLVNWSFANNHTASGSSWVFQEGEAYVNGFYIVFNGSNTGSTKPRIWLSTNLTDWSPTSVPTISNNRWFRGFAFGNNRYVAHVNDDTDQRSILFSTNLTTWTSCTTTGLESGGVTFGTNAGYFVQAGGSSLRYSTDGDNWTLVSNTWSKHDSDQFGYSGTITYGNQRYVAVTGAGRIWISTNATTWTQGPDIIDLERIGGTPGKYDMDLMFDTTNNIFLLGDRWNQNLYHTSTDGTNWMARGYWGNTRLGHSFAGNYVHNTESAIYRASSYTHNAQQGVIAYGIQPLNFSIYRITGISSV